MQERQLSSSQLSPTEVLILREVLSFQAAEVAELLGMSVAAVNSALPRARETLDARELTYGRPSGRQEAPWP